MMKYIISSSLYLLILFCLSTFIFDPTHLYYEIPWLDIPMHIMGGFGVTSLVLAIASYRKKKISYTGAILAYLCVAICWELYEFVHDLIQGFLWNRWHDTLWDIANGAFGATSAFFLLKK